MIAFDNTLNVKRDRPLQDKGIDLDALITDLGNTNGQTRQYVRISLVRIGEPAVDALIEILNGKDGLTRWEAAKALSQIGSPKAAQALVKALEDDLFSIRWLAAEGLRKLGSAGLKPLLKALRQAPDSIRLREGAHHILHDLLSQEVLDKRLLAELRSVFSALNCLSPAEVLPVSVMPALKVLEQLEN